MCAPLTPAPSDFDRFMLEHERNEARRHGYEPAPAFECKGCGFINRGMLVFCEQCKRPKG